MSLNDVFEIFRRNKGGQWTVFCPLPQEDEVKTIVKFINKGSNRVSYIRHSTKTEYFKKIELLVFLIDHDSKVDSINNKPTLFVNLKTKDVKLTIPNRGSIKNWPSILHYIRKCKYISFGIECYKKGGNRRDAIKIINFISNI